MKAVSAGDKITPRSFEERAVYLGSWSLWHLLTGAKQRLCPMEQKNTELFFCLSDQRGGIEAPGRTPKENTLTFTHTRGVSVSTRMSDSCVMKKKRHICTQLLCSWREENRHRQEVRSSASVNKVMHDGNTQLKHVEDWN